MVSSNLEIPSGSTSEEISVNELEEFSSKLFAGKCDNCNINYSGKSSKIVENSGFLDEGKKESLQP